MADDSKAGTQNSALDVNSYNQSGDINAPKKVESLLDAISEIQQFHVIESTGQHIPKEFLTINDTLSFMRVGTKSGFREGLLFVLLFPFVDFFFLPMLQRNSNDVVLSILYSLIPLIAVIINTGLCAYIARYYVGNITRKSINCLFLGRSMALLGKAGFVYVFYLFVVKLSTPERVAGLLTHCGKYASAIYNTWFFEVKPKLMPAVTKSALTIVAAAILPYLAVFILDILRQKKKKATYQGLS